MPQGRLRVPPAFPLQIAPVIGVFTRKGLRTDVGDQEPRTALAENLQRSRNRIWRDQVIVANKPDVIPLRLPNALQKIPVRPTFDSFVQKRK